MELNSQLVSLAFTRQSSVFDTMDSENKLTMHLRTIFRTEIMERADPGSRILELNCGTGIDSLFLASQGYQVLSTDNAPGMVDVLQSKINMGNLKDHIQVKLCANEALHKLGQQRFDYIVSNFGGLNCSADLDKVLCQFKEHLNEAGKLTLVIMPKVSPWELVMLLKGKGKTAFRRLIKRPKANIEELQFNVNYYNPSYVIRHLKKDFQVLSLKGIYFAVPPEFYRNFVERYPRTFLLLQSIEKKLASYFPFNWCCDHYMITLQKKPADI